MKWMFIILTVLSFVAEAQKKVVVGNGRPPRNVSVIYDTIRTTTSIIIKDTTNNKVTIYDSLYRTYIYDTTQIKTILPDSVDGVGMPGATTLESYGAIAGDGLSDQAAWNAFYADLGDWGAEVQTLLVGNGAYNFDTTLFINKKIHIIGIGNQHGGNSVFDFPDSVDGVWLQNGAAWSTIESVKLRVPGANNNTDLGNHGMVIQAHGVHLFKCEVENFSGIGFNFSAGGGTNANSCYVEHCRAVSNKAGGFRAGGSDANDITFINCDATNNGFYGFSDQSFLGNYYIGCHTATNDSMGYYAENINARSVFLGCYAEADQPPSEINNRSMYIGGINASGLTGDGSWLQGEVGGGVNSNSFKVRRLVNGSNNQTVTFGSEASGNLIVDYDRNGPEAWDWGIIYNNGTLDMGPIDIMTQYTNVRAGFRDSTELHNQVLFLDGFFLSGDGNDLNARKFYGRNAAPTTGSYIKGDRVWNIDPDQGEPSYWICTASGSPGTWTGMDTIP